ncbi:hypothetical protein EPN42_04930 [bacterium]|nr:MAG: hypothetical protein EPN42_04930 [bacterium]
METSVQSSAPSNPQAGAGYALVPFAPPGNNDTALDFATTELEKKLQAQGMSITRTLTMDPVAAAASIGTLCKQYAASGIFIGTARHEQTYKAFWGDRPTHAEVRMTLFNCDGSVRWKSYGTGDVTYWWSNAGAAVSDAIDRSLDTIVNQLEVLKSGQPNPAAGAIPDSIASPAPKATP